MQPFYVYSQPEVHAPPRFISNLPAIDEFLCINILTVTNQSFWYLLARGHQHTTPASIITLPRTPIRTVDSACATLGRNIYVLWGTSYGYPTNTVQIFDAGLGTWRQDQWMGIPRQFISAGMIGGRMYNVGGTPFVSCWGDDVFGPMSRQWSSVRMTSGIPSRTFIQNLDERFLETDNGGLLFIEDDRRPRTRDFWSMVKKTVGKMTVLDGVVYMCCVGGYITGYEQANNYSS